MKIILFTGPTMAPFEVGEFVNAICLPPVAQGDVYRVCMQRPHAIGIIDGYFESVPSVWHKEILWAMREGIHVFGSASMGALRAAELEAFGMVGVGAIFEAYRDGVLEDDDEVAVAHSSAEDGYRTFSEAMVNIRATLAKARSDSVIGEPVFAALQRIAKNLFYPERSYQHMLELGAAQCLPLDELDNFRAWLRTGAVNQKREDAVAMLEAMRGFLAVDPGPKRVSYDFEESLWWEQLRQSPGVGPRESADAMVLEELERDPVALAHARVAALGWALAAEQARRAGRGVESAAILRESAEFCKAHGLGSPEHVTTWLHENHCDRADLDRLFELRTAAARAEDLGGPALEDCLLAYLRSAGEYAPILERSRARVRETNAAVVTGQSE